MRRHIRQLLRRSLGRLLRLRLRLRLRLHGALLLDDFRPFGGGLSSSVSSSDVSALSLEDRARSLEFTPPSFFSLAGTFEVVELLWSASISSIWARRALRSAEYSLIRRLAYSTSCSLSDSRIVFFFLAIMSSRKASFASKYSRGFKRSFGLSAWTPCLSARLTPKVGASSRSASGGTWDELPFP